MWSKRIRDLHFILFKWHNICWKIQEIFSLHKNTYTRHEVFLKMQLYLYTVQCKVHVTYYCSYYSITITVLLLQLLQYIVLVCTNTMEFNVFLYCISSTVFTFSLLVPYLVLLLIVINNFFQDLSNSGGSKNYVTIQENPNIFTSIKSYKYL